MATEVVRQPDEFLARWRSDSSGKRRLSGCHIRWVEEIYRDGVKTGETPPGEPQDITADTDFPLSELFGQMLQDALAELAATRAEYLAFVERTREVHRTNERLADEVRAYRAGMSKVQADSAIDGAIAEAEAARTAGPDA